MIRRHYEYRETIATILADTESHITAAIEGMLEARRGIENAIVRDPFFAITYTPYSVPFADTAVRRMCEAAVRAEVGPMAAVAGTIAWAGVEAMQRKGATFGIIDNGGDIALLSDRAIRVGIHAGEASVSDRLAFVVPPQEKILGICTSSATVGPSVSLGTADAVTVFAQDVSLADAWATSICNQASPLSEQEALPRLDPALQGVLVVMGREVRKYGNLPPLVPANVSQDLITRGKAVHRYTGVPPDRRRYP
jgi:ApbE superfamily uncharacterized protein (UPF0280 family)